MNNIEILQEILENQREIKHLCYFIIIDHRTDQVELELAASGVSREFKFKNMSECLNKIAELLHKLKRLESYYLAKTKNK